MSWPDFTDLQTRVRDLLNESSAGFYTDDQIKRWLNDGERDVAIKGLCIESVNSLTTAASTRTVATPYNKVLYVEYATTNVGLVKINQTMLGRLDVSGIVPQFWFPWGKYIGIEPIPTAAYSLNVYASMLPSIEMSDTTDEPQIPKSFMPLIVRYAFYRGLLKAGLFSKSAQVYSAYIYGLQEARDNIMRKWRNLIADTKVPEVTVEGGQS